ncbi:pre-toxin TG domain-containing protein [Peribacillus butanolivorans]|uniref:pre-toxin TG domain-containing protein n=1 Tax=Peribacillus butanolivorans TaxID=421767 RepID=UPI0036DCA602
MGYDKTFTGEFTGYYDSIRASTGVDPVTGRKVVRSRTNRRRSHGRRWIYPCSRLGRPGH